VEKVEGKKQYNPNTDARLVRHEMCFVMGFIGDLDRTVGVCFLDCYLMAVTFPYSLGLFADLGSGV
jgi:hypothetical protein